MFISNVSGILDCRSIGKAIGYFSCVFTILLWTHALLRATYLRALFPSGSSAGSSYIGGLMHYLNPEFRVYMGSA